MASRRQAGRRRLIAGAAALAAVVLAVVGFRLATAGSGAQAALEEFLAAFAAGDYDGAAALTDGRGKEVAAALEANVEGLDGAELEADVLAVEEDGDGATARVEMSWEVPAIGGFAYENEAIELVREGEEWLVRWREDVVHRELEDGTRLGTEKVWPERAPILGRGGTELVTPRPVVEIGVVPGELRDVDAAVGAIAAATEADAKTLRRSIEAAASPQNFVPAITVRASEFQPISERLDPIRGIEFGHRELPLAPTREFARALLGTVAPITAEQLEELGAPYAVGDVVGQSGLQASFEERLAGTPDRSVITRLADGTPDETLMEVEGERGRPLRTTLDAGVQAAAEQALGDADDPAALVAVEPSSGDVLASASRPVEDAFNRAFEGQYPPGSTFKVITTAALLEAGLDPDEIVECPATIEAGGRYFRNFEGSAAGAVPFRTDFAESCNTAFVSLADRLAPADFPRFGARFGLGADADPGVPHFGGDVPAPEDETEQAAQMIGQGRILASPLAMAGVAATVADGRWRAPRVLAEDPRFAGEPLAAPQIAQLRSLMREVVTHGTGTELADVPGEPIGKSGTAEYGSGDPPPTHAWFIAARGDLAVAVLVEDRPSGAEFAAPIAAWFLEALDPGEGRDGDFRDPSDPTMREGGAPEASS